MQPRIITIFVLLFAILTANPCLAHKVRIFAWGEGDTIHTESKFSGGRSARGASVSVVDSATGTELLNGTTDESGLFDFEQPENSTAFDIVISSGDGHKNSWHYEVEQPQGEVSEPVKSSTPKVVAEKTVKPKAPVATPSGITKDELTQIIDERLEAKLAPIRRMLAESEDKGPSIQDILGGIGYIIGLAGLAAYMKSQKR